MVIGTSGAGKSTLAVEIGARFGLPVIELDALNWRPGWVARAVTDPAGFLADVDAATAGPGWVAVGNYGTARHLVWSRATDIVWLDYTRPVVMGRVIRRSAIRAWRREVIWGGNRESFAGWLAPDHPIQCAWRTWQTNRTAAIARLSEPGSAHLRVTQVLRPHDAGKVIRRLAPD